MLRVSALNPYNSCPVSKPYKLLVQVIFKKESKVMTKPTRMERGISARVTAHRPNLWERTTLPALMAGSGTTPGDG